MKDLSSNNPQTGEARGTPRFAQATFDTSFKHMMTDPEIRLSFLRVFTGMEDIVTVEAYPTAIPPLRSSKKKTLSFSQRHMDFSCRIKNGDIFIAEVQIQKHNHWNARSLYYAASVYSQQLAPGESWDSLHNVIGINIVDYETGSLDPGEFERHYIMTDTLHPQDTWPYIKILQFELPRVDFSLILEKEKREWLKIFKESATMETIPEDFSPETKKVLQMLDFRQWKGDLMAQHRNEEKFDIKNYSIVMGETFEKGMIQGEQRGLFTGITKIARLMLQEGDPLEKIIRLTGLSEADIAKLQSDTPLVL